VEEVEGDWGGSLKGVGHSSAAMIANLNGLGDMNMENLDF
jgi:hypothetical protein